MTYRTLVLLALAGMSTGLAPSAVCAQAHEQDHDVLFDEAEQEAARLAFQDGRKAFELGRYARALERFEHAYALSQRSELLFNIGLAADRIREDERALEAFEQYLEETPDSAHREQVQLRVAALRDVLARKTKAQPKAPTPVEVAAANTHETAPSPFSSEQSPRDDEGGVLSEWWFWTGASVLLIAGGATAYLVLQPEEKAALPQPNTGVIVPTLRLAP